MCVIFEKNAYLPLKKPKTGPPYDSDAGSDHHTSPFKLETFRKHFEK